MPASGDNYVDGRALSRFVVVSFMVTSQRPCSRNVNPMNDEKELTILNSGSYI